ATQRRRADRAPAAGGASTVAGRGCSCPGRGVPGAASRISVCSVVGRFLEQTRCFSFGLGEEEEIYISSADWMPRNFYRRVELMVPVLDDKAKEKIRQEVFEPMLKDNCRARDLTKDGEDVRRAPPPGDAAYANHHTRT